MNTNIKLVGYKKNIMMDIIHSNHRVDTIRFDNYKEFDLFARGILDFMTFDADGLVE